MATAQFYDKDKIDRLLVDKVDVSELSGENPIPEILTQHEINDALIKIWKALGGKTI